MIRISHRGNINGRELSMENQPEYIKNCLNFADAAEIDVWNINEKWFLGHDVPQYEIETSFFNEKLWCHAKNLNALYKLLSLNIHCFWHQEDDYAMTSKGYIWTYPGKQLTNKSIAVMPEINFDKSINICAGICSDYPLMWGDK